MNEYKTIVESNNFIVLDKYNKERSVAEGYHSEGLPHEIELRQNYRNLLIPLLRRGGRRSLTGW